MDSTQETVVNIRWLDIGDRAIEAEILAAAQGAELRDVRKAAKIAALDKLGIAVAEGDTPLAAYTRAMCEENGFPYTTPAPAAVGDAIISCASRFFWWLA